MNVTDILAENAHAVQSAKQRNRILQDGILSETARLLPSDATLSDIVQRYISVMGDDICTPAFARYCDFVWENGGTLTFDDLLPESVRVVPEFSEAKVAYQKNPYSDRAFSILTGHLFDAGAVCLPTTVSVCEEIYYGRCTHCILPIYSTSDGILTAFTKLIAKYDLVINAACDVSAPDGDSVMRFALLRHELAMPAADPCYVQFNAVLPPSVSLAKLLTACESVGASVAEMITQPLAYTAANISYTIRLRTSSECLGTLLMLLRCILGDYSLEGIFNII